MVFQFPFLFCFPACSSPNIQYIGIGWCFDENNNAACGFDGGDCCGPDVKTAFCTECECLGENLTSKPAPGPFCSCSVEGAIGCELLIYFKKIVKSWPSLILIFQAVKTLAKWVMVIVKMIQILQSVTMMEEIAVDLMSTYKFVLIVYAILMILVMVHLTWYPMDTAMM